jgi:hypothetical protein
MDINDTTLGKTYNGDSSAAIGKADDILVSLGDGGEALFYFENPISDEPGHDFALFENGFANPADASMAYLELAEVEVSNDGLTFYKFESISNTDTMLQIAGFGDYMDASLIHNLAGKYRASYGTPFDLSDLSNISTLDRSNIRYVRVRDVVGTIGATNCTLDNSGRKINDPFPTPFPGGGFDLDALGIIHQKYPNHVSTLSTDEEIRIFPNPLQTELHWNHQLNVQWLAIHTLDGRFVYNGKPNNSSVDVSGLSRGHYYLTLSLSNGVRLTQRFVKYE